MSRPAPPRASPSRPDAADDPDGAEVAGDAPPLRRRRLVLRADPGAAVPRPHLLRRPGQRPFRRPALLQSRRAARRGGSTRAASSTAGRAASAPPGRSACRSARPCRRAGSWARRCWSPGSAIRPCSSRRRASTSSPTRSGRSAPRLSPSSARAGSARPGVRFEDLPKIDLVLVSHNHYDHLDLPTLSRLWERDRPLIVTSLGNDAILRGAGIDRPRATGAGASPCPAAAR